MKTVPLGEVAEFVRGVTFKPADVSAEGVGVMRTKNVQTELDLTDVLRVPAAIVRRADQYLRPGDTLVSSANSWAAVGKACWVPALPEPLAIGGFVTALRPDEERIHPRYLYRWFTAPRTQRALRSFSNQTTNIANLNLRLASAMSIPLPPAREQRRIASILDQADALRAKRRQYVDTLRAAGQLIFRDLFGSHRAEAPVADVATEVRTGPFGSQLLHAEFVGEGIAVLGLDNVVGNEFRWVGRRFITESKYEKLKRYTVRPGDVLISIMGTVGRCVVVPDGIGTAINTKHICAVTVDTDRIVPAFLRGAFLWHPESRAHLLAQTKGSIMAGLNMGIIKAMPVPVPPLGLQREFADRVRAIDAQRAVAELSLQRLDELFASLQARAFSGTL